MNVSELEGDKLDFWVGKSDKKDPGVRANGRVVLIDRYGDSYSYSPSTDWSQGGPIIERERISLDALSDGGYATVKTGKFWKGGTALIAAMRCFVAERFGEEVDDN